MRNLLILFLLVTISLGAVQDAELQSRIHRYSGDHAPQLINLLTTSRGDTLRYAEFLLENASPNDLAALTADYLKTNISCALKSRKMPYAHQYSEDIFRHFVLPHRISQEPLEPWRESFYTTLAPLVKDEQDITKAAILVNLWVLEQMTYKPTHGRDQAPLTTIRRGYGRCEENMILYIAAARSVGIPCRPASVPYWNFTDSNHAWVEIWTPDGWRYMGEPENSLNRAWFSKTTERATMILSEAYGDFQDPTAIKHENNMTYLSSIEYYTESQPCTITVQDSFGMPVSNASVALYATSFGGLFPMVTLTTDNSGAVVVPLGKSTVFAMATKDDLSAWSRFCTIDANQLTLVLRKATEIEADFTMNFPLVTDTENPYKNTEILGDKFYLMRENSNLKRDKRLNSQKQSNLFIRYFHRVIPLIKNDPSYDSRETAFLEKCDELAGNSESFLAVARKLDASAQTTKLAILVDMIEQWNIKELCEIPDSTAISHLIDIYAQGKHRFSGIYPDSLFTDYVIGPTWHSATPPQNNWQPEFIHMLESCVSKSPEETVSRLLQYVTAHTRIDSDFVFSYFSGSLNPVQILRMKNIPQFYRTKIINSGLKLLGIPVQWKGRLEYHDGTQFVAVMPQTVSEKPSTEDHFTLRIFVDDQPVKPEAWGNFLIADRSDSNLMSNTYFDGETDSLVFRGTYRRTADEPVFLQAFTRNANGDAHVKIHTLSPGEDVLLHLSTPSCYIDYSARWSEATRQNVATFVGFLPGDSQKLIIIRGPQRNEPEVHILNQLEKYKSQLETATADVAICSVRSQKSDLTSRFPYPVFAKKPLVTEDLHSQDYPVVLLTTPEGTITFSSVGYNMGVMEIILRLLK